MKPRKSPASGSAAKPAATRSVIDVALIGAGLASAAASVVFVAAMVSRGDHAPLVNGMQYLAIFAQPRLHGAAAPQVAAVAAPPKPASAGVVGSIDFDPTGAIFRFAAERGFQVDPYRLVAVEPGMAWLRNSAEMRVVRPGDFAPGLGRVAAIVKRDGRWALVDDSGAVLLAAERSDDAAAGDDPFSRRMIFGAGD